MQIKRLFMVNFLAVGPTPVEILFPQDGGITQIRGFNHDVSKKSSNAAGKSVIVEGIIFALYGKVLRNLTLNEIVNSHAKDGGCHVELEFDNCRIVRKIKPNSVEFYIDGVRQGTNASLIEIKKAIEDHLSINFETMCNILIFGQHNLVSFLDAKPADKREIVENLMNLRDYNIYEDRVRKLNREANTNLKVLVESHNVSEGHLAEQQKMLNEQNTKLLAYQKTLEDEIAAIAKRIQAIPDVDSIRLQCSAYDEYQSKVADMERQHQSIILNLQVAESDLKKVKHDHLEESKQRQPITDRLEAVKQKSSDLQERRHVYMQGLDSLKSKVNDASNSVKELTLEERSKLNSIQRKDYFVSIGHLRKTVNQFADKIRLAASSAPKDAICPVCFGPVDPNNLKAYVLHLEEEKAKVEAELTEMVAKDAEDSQRVLDEKSAITAIYASKIAVAVSAEAEAKTELESAMLEIEQQYTEALGQIENRKKLIESDLAAFDAALTEKYQPIYVEKQKQVEVVQSTLDALSLQRKNIKPVSKPQYSLEELGQLQASKKHEESLLVARQEQLKANPFTDIVTSLQANIDTIRNTITDTTGKIKEIEKLLPYYEWWVTHFGTEGLKSFVVAQILPTLNRQINYWMQFLYQNAISVCFNRYFDVILTNNLTKREMVFGQGSGGERRRIDIAIMLAFRSIMKTSTGQNPNIMFMDECAENLDEDGVYRLYDAIEQIAQDNHVYVITHNPHLMSLLQSADTLDVEKRDGIMTLAA